MSCLWACRIIYMCLYFLISNMEIMIVPNSFKFLRIKWVNLFKTLLLQTLNKHSHPVNIYYFWPLLLPWSTYHHESLASDCHISYLWHLFPPEVLSILQSFHMAWHTWTCSISLSQHLGYLKVSCFVYSIFKHLVRSPYLLDVDLPLGFTGIRMWLIFPLLLLSVFVFGLGWQNCVLFLYAL